MKLTNIIYGMRKNLKIIFLLLFIVCFRCEEKGQEEEVEKVVYEVIFRGSLAGNYEKWRVGKQDFQYTYNYSDRGRGPDFEESITITDQGMISAQSIKGVNYRKTPIEEYFEQEAGLARWKNSRTESESQIAGDQLYFRYDGSPAIYEILAQGLLQSDDNEIDLFPEGEVVLAKTFSITLSNRIDVQLLMILGLDMNPTYLWMKDRQMVGKISGNLHIVRKDMSAFRVEMKELQDEIEDNYLKELAQNLTTVVEKAVITNVAVFTAVGSLLEGQDVFVEGSRIVRVAPSGSVPVNENYTVLDGAGKTLMPGLFDMHTHNTKFRGLLHLAGGVTSVRDLANNKQLKQLSAQFVDNEIIGPRIVTFCGIIDGSGPFANQRNVVDNLEEGLAEIQVYKDLGYQQIKLYSSIRPEWVKPLVDKAHDLGMRVSGHIPAYMTASQAITQGYNEIQHINMLFLNFLSDTIDTRTPLRHTMPAKYGKDLDLNSKEYKDFVRLLKEKDILVDLTLGIFENMYLSKVGEVSPTYAAISDRMPLMNQRRFYGGGLRKTKEEEVTYQHSFDKMLEVIYDLYQKGIDVVPGTDGLPGFLYHRELELYVKAGIPAAEVLKIATIKSAKITGMEETLGSIEEGKKADLILIDGNPLDNISDIRRIEWTMKGGNLYNAKALYSMQGIKHFK